jgi:hypothetical protein
MHPGNDRISPIDLVHDPLKLGDREGPELGIRHRLDPRLVLVHAGRGCSLE